MRNLFILNSPLQYLLARSIANQFFAHDENCVIQSVDNGDFIAAFDQVDTVIGARRFSNWWRHAPGEEMPEGSFDRFFMSNRFNPAEIDIALRLRGNVGRYALFEDGISIYLGHYFLNEARGDLVLKSRIKNAIKIGLRRRGVIGPKRSDYIPLSWFDDVYSIYPDVPGLRDSTGKIPIADQFLAECRAGDGVQDEAIEGSVCVVLSQSLVTDQLIKEAPFVDFIADRIAELKTRYDHVLFKAHPRDPAALKAAAADLKAEPFPEAMRVCPVELFAARHPGVDIYGFWSSTLAYSPVFDARSYSFGEMLAESRGAEPALHASWRNNKRLMDRFGVAPYQLADA